MSTDPAIGSTTGPTPGPAPDDEIGLRSATELAADYRAGRRSPVEVTEALLGRIERLNPAVNAYCLVDADRALADARAARDRYAAGEPRGPLDGVPVSIKDLLLTAGWPTLRGSRTIDEAGPWTADAPCVARLREAGAVVLGKTTTPELGWKGVTDNPLTGVTRNPWDPSATSGGSSGGAAAAVALGLGPLAVGTDGGGSIRIPAAFCGVFGLKPTYGTVPIHPASPFGTLAHAGPITRTVADAAALLDVISRPDARDWSAGPEPAGTFAGDADVTGLRVAYSRTLGYARVDPQVAEAVDDAVAALAGRGARVTECDPGFPDPVEAFHVLWFAGAAKCVQPLDDAALATIDPGLREVAELGARLSASDYLDAVAVRMALGTAMGTFHRDYDLLVTPAMPIPAFPAGQEVPTGWDAPRWTSWTPFTYPFNMTQQPAATVPCGRTAAGLPIGVQVVGARHRDALVLTCCRALEAALAGRNTPAVPALARNGHPARSHSVDPDASVANIPDMPSF